jgi:predicted nucleic acid-binding Zn ribbon protein
MAEDDHRHCKSCGKVCEPDDEVCSPACRTKRENSLRTRRVYTYLLYALMVILLLAFAYRSY